MSAYLIHHLIFTIPDLPFSDLAAYNAANSLIWHSNTAGAVGTYTVQVTNSGYVQILNNAPVPTPTSTLIWQLPCPANSFCGPQQSTIGFLSTGNSKLYSPSLRYMLIIQVGFGKGISA